MKSAVLLRIKPKAFWEADMTQWHVISGGVTAPKGYRAAGIAAGLKPSGQPDLALIVSDVEAIAAGVFTTSQVRAACVDYCRQRLQAKSSSRAILCNAGQANAATGEQGWAEALETAQLLGEALLRRGWVMHDGGMSLLFMCNHS